MGEPEVVQVGRAGRDVADAPKFAAYGYDEHAGTWESPEPHPDITATNWIWSDKDRVKRWDRTAFFVDKTLDFVRRHKGRPCFVNVWLDDPHTPWVPAAGAGEVSTFIRSVNNLPLLVERTMMWDADARAGSAEAALDSTNMQWFFAEGAQGALRTNLILANPNDAPVTVTVTFMLESGAPIARTYDVGPLARRTIAFDDVPAVAGRSFGPQ